MAKILKSGDIGYPNPTDGVELITRYEKGSEMYSVDGGRHWWTKEQLDYISQATAQAERRGRIKEWGWFRKNAEVWTGVDDTKIRGYEITPKKIDARLKALQAQTGDSDG